MLISQLLENPAEKFDSVRFDVFSGASAGAMSLGLLVHTLAHPDFAGSTDEPLERQREAWVKRVDIRNLIPDPKMKRVNSLLGRGAVDQIAGHQPAHAVSMERTPQLPALIEEAHARAAPHSSLAVGAPRLTAAGSRSAASPIADRLLRRLENWRTSERAIRSRQFDHLLPVIRPIPKQPPPWAHLPCPYRRWSAMSDNSSLRVVRVHVSMCYFW